MPETHEQMAQRLRSGIHEYVDNRYLNADQNAEQRAFRNLWNAALEAGAAALERCAKIDAAIAGGALISADDRSGRVRDMQERIAALEAELAEARKDSARLEYIIDAFGACSHRIPEALGLCGDDHFEGEEDDQRINWRAAIDAAREGVQE